MRWCVLFEAAGAVEGRPRVGAVDGRGVSGGSTLAVQLHTAVPRSAVVHSDDVAWHHPSFDWTDLLAASVRAPLHRGRQCATARRADRQATQRGVPSRSVEEVEAPLIPAAAEVVWLVLVLVAALLAVALVVWLLRRSR